MGEPREARPRLFILEDDEGVASVISAVAEDEGWEVLRWPRVFGAMGKMRGFRPDLILLDVELPDGTGLAVCEELRQDASLASSAVLFLTSRSGLQDKLKGFQLGAQDYMVKPFDLAELIARLGAHLETKRRADSLRREKEELALRERARQDMADMIVHDMRSPLAAIRLTVDMLLESGLLQRPEYARMVQSAGSSADLLLLMVNDLLDVGAGTVKAQPSPLDARALEERLRALFSLRCQGTGVALGLALPPEASGWPTDGMVLFRVLANLVSNALKFSSRGQAVEVGGRLEGGCLRLEVSDRGPGVPEAEKERIFEKYYRCSGEAHRRVPGTGIGLAFCRLAAEAMGGRIWVQDRPGGGSVFLLDLPNAPCSGATG